MKYQYLVRDFAKRTIDNVKLLEKHYGSKDRYEVTQLINSLYGLVIIPKEKALSYIPELNLQQLAASGWPQFEIIKDDTRCDNLRKLIVNLRNGAAHAKIEFEDQGGKIEKLTIANRWNQKHWRARISVDDLRIFVERFAEILENIRLPSNL
jgi:hypothetical protein